MKHIKRFNEISNDFPINERINKQTNNSLFDIQSGKFLENNTVEEALKILAEGVLSADGYRF